MPTPRENAWNEFVDWCGGRGLHAMPAHPWTIAAYIRWLEHRASPSAIQRIVRAIARQHREKSRKRPERHPTVARTLRGVEYRARERRRRRTAGPSLFPEEELVPIKVAKTGNGKAKGTKGAKSAKAAEPPEPANRANGKTAKRASTDKSAKKATKKKADTATGTAKAVRPMRHTPRLVRKRKLDG